jgi:hypothetical protein
LPETPAELYAAMVRQIMNGALCSANTKSIPLLGTDELLGSLPSIAWRLVNREAGAKRFDRRGLVDAICSAGHSLEKAGKLIDQLVDLGFLASGHHEDREQFEFCHSTFCDFLAASHVAARVNSDGWNCADVDAWMANSRWRVANAGTLLDAHAFEASWEPVIIFVAGLVREPLPLFEIWRTERETIFTDTGLDFCAGATRRSVCPLKQISHGAFRRCSRKSCESQDVASAMIQAIESLGWSGSRFFYLRRLLWSAFATGFWHLMAAITAGRSR